MDYKELAEELINYQFKLSKMPRDLSRLERSRGEHSTMVYLIEIEDGVAPSKIAKFISVSTARMASILNNLEKKGEIVRTPDPKDGRRLIVNFTEKGRQTAEDIRNSRVNDVSKMLEALGEHDASEHIRIMKKIYEVVHESECGGNKDD